jgi:hypothetical protein
VLGSEDSELVEKYGKPFIMMLRRRAGIFRGEDAPSLFMLDENSMADAQAPARAKLRNLST